jgi:glycosyltransferase involved in cell wall biosynthesis
MIYYSNLNPLLQRDAKAFISRGDVVDLFCYGLPHEKKASPDRQLSIHRLMNRKFDEKGPLNYLLKIAYFFLIVAIKVSILHIKKPFDLIYIVSPPDFMIFTGVIPKLLGAKIVLNIHDIVPEFYMRKFGVEENHMMIKLLKFVEKICCHIANHVFTVTDIWRNRLIARTGISESKCTVLMNVPDNALIDRVLEKGMMSSKDFRLLYPGNLGEHFGVETLIRAMPIVKAEIPSIRLDIYGEGPQRDFLQTLAKDLSVDQLVSFYKYIPVEDLYLIMKQVDIGIVPTLDGIFAGEALSTKSLEFLAIGIPVVISRTKVSQFYYNDSMVMFFKQGDHSDLANCIIQLYKNPGKRKELVRNAKFFNEKHNWENYKEIYYRTVDSLCQRLNQENG